MIYFVQEAWSDKSPIKIGFSGGDVRNRVSHLQSASPAPLCLLAAVDGSQQDEQKEHRRWKHLRLHGEWFRADAELVEYIGSFRCIPELFGVAGRRRQMGITPDWLALVTKEPRLHDLLGRAIRTRDDAKDFCANHVWYGCSLRDRCTTCRGGLRTALAELVGWSAECPELATERAYSLAYDTLFGALPGCRGCGCLSASDFE